MIVKKLIQLLKKENESSEVFAYLGAKEGWSIVPLGYGDAIIGKSRTDKDSFVLIPVEVPEKFDKWDETGESYV